LHTVRETACTPCRRRLTHRAGDGLHTVQETAYTPCGRRLAHRAGDGLHIVRETVLVVFNLLSLYYIKPNVGNKSARDTHRAVRLLEVFQNGNDCPGDRNGCSVEHVDKLILAVRVLKTDIEPSRLIIGTV